MIRHGLGHARARLSVFLRVWTWSSSQTTNQRLHLGWSNWFVEQGRTLFVSMVCKR